MRDLLTCVVAVVVILVAGCSSPATMPADVARQFGKTIVPDPDRISIDPAPDTPPERERTAIADAAPLFPPEAQVITNQLREPEEFDPAGDDPTPVSPPADASTSPAEEPPKPKHSGLLPLLFAAAAALYVAWMQRSSRKEESQDGQESEADHDDPGATI